jgi:hypothetical protein
LGTPLKKLEKIILSILEKLNSKTRTEAALRAVNLGFILLAILQRRNIVTGTTEVEDMALEHAEKAFRVQ